MKHSVKKLIQEGKTEQALSEMLTHGYKDAALLINKLNRAQKKYHLAIYDNQDLQKIEAEIGYAVLNLLEGKPINSGLLQDAETVINQPSLNLAIGVVLLEIVIGFLGELMPDDLKKKVETLCGGYYTSIWIIVVCITIAFFVWLYLRYEGYFSKNNSLVDTVSGKVIISNYQANINAKRPLWRRLFYAVFKNWQPDKDFIKAIGLSTVEEAFYTTSLNNYTPLHFSYNQKGAYEKDDIVRFLLKNIENTEGTRYLLLVESGCGKTTILYKLFCEYVKRHKYKPIIMREFRNGHTDIMDMKLEDQKNTILILDGLDEDLDTIRNPKETFEKLADKLKNFKCVVLSARLQLFKDHNDEPTKITQFIEFNHLYLDVLSDEDTLFFLRRKFQVKKGFRERFNKEGKVKLDAALALIKSNNRFVDILRRPFLLQYIDLLLSSNAEANQPTKTIRFAPKFGFEYEIYEKFI